MHKILFLLLRDMDLKLLLLDNLALDLISNTYLFYIHDYAKMHPFDEVNCVANIYGFYGNEGPIQDPIIGNEKFFIVGCFKTPDEFVFIDENVSEEPALYPRNCP